MQQSCVQHTNHLGTTGKHQWLTGRVPQVLPKRTTCWPLSVAYYLFELPVAHCLCQRGLLFRDPYSFWNIAEKWKDDFKRQSGWLPERSWEPEHKGPIHLMRYWCLLVSKKTPNNVVVSLARLYCWKMKYNRVCDNTTLFSIYLVINIKIS